MNNFDNKLIEKELLKILKKVEIVSFDLYDTLIFRTVKKPIDVFDIIEKKYNKINANNKIKNFQKNRIKAEIKCRKIKKNIEVTLDEIYDELKKKYLTDEIYKIKKIEKELEIDLAIPNEKIITIYNWCIDNNKKIIITTDMYLDIETISNILKKCNINNYKKIFLSSEYGYRKKNGTMFDVITKELSIKPEKILHIGDNYTSDIIQASNKNINTWYVKQDKKIDLYQNNKNTSKLVENFLLNYYGNNDNYYRTVGEHVLGPLLYGYSYWLNEHVKNKKPEKILFLARDGKIIKNAYESIFGKNVNNIYVYGSRRALIVPTIWKDCSIDNIQKSIHFHDRISVTEVFERIGLDMDKYEKKLLNIGIKKDDNINGTNLKNDKKFIKIFAEFKNDIYQNSKIEYECAIKYWKNIIGNSKKVFIVDIGWNGNMQNALLKLLSDTRINIEGFYLGVNPSTNYDFPMYGYIYDKTHNKELKNIIENFSGLLETMFMTNHGSLKKYIIDIPSCEFYSNEYENSDKKLIDEIYAINSIQFGAIEFINKFDLYIKQTYASFSLSDSYLNLINLGLHPSTLSATMFGDFRFFNSSKSYIACPTNNKFNFKELINTNWRIGYLKRCFKINVRYDLIAKLIKKLKKIILLKRKVITKGRNEKKIN